MESLSEEIQARLGTSKDKKEALSLIDSLDSEVKKDLLEQIKETYKKILLIEAEVKSQKRLKQILLEEDTELKYWLNQKKSQEGLVSIYKDIYEKKRKQNNEWYALMQEDGHSVEKIKEWDDMLNEQFKLITRVYHEAKEALATATSILKNNETYNQYKNVELNLKKVQDTMKDLPYVIYNDDGVARIKLDSLISEVLQRKRAREYDTKKKEKEFLKRVKRLGPNKFKF